MKGKLGVWIWLAVAAFFLLGLAGTSFVGYKIYKRKKGGPQVWEARMQLNQPEGLSPEQTEQYVESLDAAFRRYEVLRPIVDEMKLTERWGVGVEDAMKRLQDEIQVKKADGQVFLAIKDKDQELARTIGQQVMDSFMRVERLERYGLPTMPAP